MVTQANLGKFFVRNFTFGGWIDRWKSNHSRWNGKFNLVFIWAYAIAFMALLPFALILILEENLSDWRWIRKQRTDIDVQPSEKDPFGDSHRGPF